MAKESLFLSFVRLTLKKWVGFQAAIVEGMGGPFAVEKEVWLGTEIENYFKSYNDSSPDDLEEYLGAMIENEFDTYFEDGSLSEICKLFCEAYSLSLVNPNAPIFQIVKNHQPTIPVASCSKQSSQCEETVTEKTLTSDMKMLEINDSEENSWTVVSRKAHKK